MTRRHYQDARSGWLERFLSCFLDRLDGVSLGISASPVLGLMVISWLVAGVFIDAVRRSVGLYIGLPGAARSRCCPRAAPSRPTTARPRKGMPWPRTGT
jgi:hypothetical protein